jgi:hypothetical protein
LRPRVNIRRSPAPAPLSLIVVLVVGLFAGATAPRAQDIEPRQYANTPIGVNFVVLGYLQSEGGLAFDSTLPVSNPELETSSGALGFARAFELLGYSAKVDASVPYAWLDGSAEFQGQTLERTVDGFGDPVFRLSANLYGAPPLQLKDFAAYSQDLIIGAALQVSAPLGQYDDTRLVNIGTNRWFFKPSLGASKALGPWIVEATGAVTIFTVNEDFFGGNRREQDPLYSLQGHVIRSFRSGIWAALNTTYFWGGSTTINGAARNDLQRNWRVGATLAVPVDARHSIKLVASDGVSARTGNSYRQFGLFWQYRWGGGI